MKKTTKLVLLVCIALLSCVLMFAACDSGNKPQMPSGTSNITTTVEETITVEETTETHVCTFGEWATIKDPTCTENGQQERTCVCGEKETQSIVARGHSEVIDEAVAPTCTETGLTEGKHCSVCDYVILVQDIVPASHSWKDEYDMNDDCHWRVCGVCGLDSDVEKHGVNDDGCCIICDALVSATKGVIYDLSPDGTYAEVIGYEGTSTRVMIAETYNGIPVRTIYNNAFYGTNIIEVVIPEGVISIGESAFSCCYSLTSITIPDTLLEIGVHAFLYSDNLPFVYNSNCKYLGTKYNPYFALLDVTNKNHSSYEISTDTKVIADYTFWDCTRLTSIIIPDGMRGIGSSAFNNCALLASVVIPDSVVYLGDRAFQDCENLSSAIISKNITFIDVGTFYDCKKLSKIVIGNKVSYIGVEAFLGCEKLDTVVIGNGVTFIDPWAFGYCDNLKNIYFIGSEDEWNKITIEDGNWPITNNTVQYNYVYEK